MPEKQEEKNEETVKVIVSRFNVKPVQLDDDLFPVGEEIKTESER